MIRVIRVILVIILLSAAIARSATCTWTNGAGTNLWSAAGNWSCGAIPGSGDAVEFNSGSANCYYDRLNNSIASITMTSGYTGKFQWGYAQFGKGIRGNYYSDNAYTGSTYSRVDATVNFPDNWAVSMPGSIGAADTRTIWHGWVLPLHTQTYTFYETSDDGGRLWVNGSLIIDQFNAGGMTEYTGTIALTAGTPVEIKYEMYQGGGNSGALLSWSCTGLTKQIIPQNLLFPDRNGLKAQWWQNTDMTGTTGTNAVPFIDFNWGGGSPGEFFAGTDFSAEFQGFIIPQYTETYTFYAAKDDGARVYVNDVLVIDSWNCCGEPTGTIDLVAGVPYYIEVEFRDTGSDSWLNLSWSSASRGKQIVPVERLYLPYWLNVTGTVDLRSGGEINMGAGELQFTGGSAQTFYPKSGTKLSRLIQNGAGGTTVTTNDLTVSYLEVRSGTFNLGTGRTVTPDYFKANGGTMNFGTSSFYLSQAATAFTPLGSATSGAAGSQIILNGGGAQTVSGTITGTDVDITCASGATTTLSAVLATGTDSLTKSGPGPLNRSGANTFSGGFTHANSGTTNVQHNTALGSGAATISAAGKIVVASGITANNALAISACDPGSGRGALEGPASGTGTWSGIITINSSCTTGGHLVGGGGRLTVTGAINSASTPLVARDMNITLSGGGSYADFSTGTSTITVGATNGISTEAVMNIGTSGTSTVDLNGFSQTIAGLKRSNGAATATLTNLSGTAATLTINTTTTNTYEGVIAGNLTLTKSGSGTQIHSGTNTYTGGTNVAAGTLSVGASANLGSPSGAYLVVFTGTSTLAVTGSFSTTKAFWLNDNVTGTFDIATSQTLTANGTLHAITGNPIYKAGAGTLILGVDNAQIDNDIYLTAGTLEGRAADAFGNGNGNDAIYASAGTTLRLVGDADIDFNSHLSAGGAGVNLVIDRITAGAGVNHHLHWTNITGAYTLNVSSGASITSGTAGYTSDLGGTLGGHAVLNVTDPATPDILLTWATAINGSGYNLTVQGTGNTTVSGVIQTGAGTVTKAGTGTLLLSGANTYTGLTTVSAGVLRVGDATALGTVAAGTSVTSGATLDLNGTSYTNAEALTLNGTGISSGGALMNSSATGATFAGLVTLGSTSSILGGTGTIALSHTGTISGAGYALTLGGTQGGTIASILGTTNGTLTKEGTGAWTLNGTSTRTGTTSLDAGTLTVTATTGLGSGNLTLNTCTLRLLLNGSGSDGTITLGNNLTTNSSNSPVLYVANNGSNTGNTIAFGTYSMGNATLSLTGANGYKVSTGAMTLNGGSNGTVTFTPTTSDITIASVVGNNNTHTLTLDGTSTASAIPGAIVNGAAAVTLAKTNSSTWTLGGANTYTGTTTVTAGTLNLTGSLAAGTATTVASGATLMGTGSLAGTVAVSAGGIVAPGATTAGGTLSTGAGTLAATSVLNCILTSEPSTSSKLAVTGNFTLDGTVNVTAGVGLTVGTYTLATYTGTLTNNTLNVGTLPAGYFGTITAGGNLVTLSLIDFSGWNYISTIHFNTTSSGANVSSNVTDFPMLVRLDSNNFLFSQAMPDGRDIRFADPDGTLLSYEIERWDAALKKAEIWVKVPQVDGNSDRDFINVYWGNNAATSLSLASGVFGAYKAAYHLSQSPGAGAGGFVDGSGNANHGTAQGPGVAGDSSTSNIGMGFKLNGSSKYVSTTTQFNSINTFTAAAWFKTTTSSGGKIIGWGSAITGSSGQMDRHTWMDNTGKLHFSVYNGAQRKISSTAAYNDGEWHLVVQRLGPSGLSLYVDGALVVTDASVTTAEGNNGYWRVGYDNLAGWTPSPTSNWFNGTVDEFTVAHAEFSADYIKLAYATQKRNSTALVYPNTALSTWGYSSKVYVNTSATGANTTTDVSNFPMLVRLTGGNFNWAQAKSDGGDLRFADSTGALLPYELVRFDAANKVGEAWVLLPTVKGNDNAQWFRMYWGKASATSLSSAISVFQASNNFVGDWHLNETSGPAYDATSYANNGTFTGSVPNPQTGLIGKAHLFDGNGDYINAGTNATYDMSANDRVTVSAWVNRSGAAVAGSYEGIASRYPWPTNNRSFGIWHYATTGFAFAVSTDGTAETTASLGTAATNGLWYHVVGVADGTRARLYVNGVEAASTAFTGNIFAPASANFKIGVNEDDAGSNRQYWNGYIDEVTLSKVARSPDWVKLQYESQKAAANTVTIGARSGDFTASLRLNFNTTSMGLSADVTNIPILVRLGSDNFDFSKTTGTGTDLQFVDKDGSNLYHEVVEWDRANSVGKVWVKVPQVDRNVSTDFITLYYGCATCTASPYAVKDSVWSAYNAVYHLNGGVGDMMDATAYGDTATRTADMATSTGITAALGPVMNGTTDQINIPNSNPLDGETVTMGFWIKTTAVGTDATWYNSVWLADRDAPGSANAGWAVVLANASGRIRFIAVDDDLTSNADISNGVWRRVDLVKTPSNKYIYIDGVLDNSEADAGALSNNENVHLGGENSNAHFTAAQWNGFTLAPTQRSADFIKLSYENQKEASTFFSTTTISPASFQRNKVFNLNTTASGANVAGDVYNFPLLLRVTGLASGSATPITDITLSAGQDIRFLDGDGVTWLDYQIERWSPSADSAEVWVKVPRIRGNSAADKITMYYQQASGVTVPDGQCATCVFNTANGIAAAWHLDEDGNNTASGYLDASNGAHHATGTSMTTSSDVAGIVGLSQDFDGAADFLTVTDHADFDPEQGVTLELWAYPTDAGTTIRSLVNKGRDNVSGSWWQGLYRSSDATGRWRVQVGATAQTSGTTATQNSWSHVALSYLPGGKFILFVNGTGVDSGNVVVGEPKNGTENVAIAKSFGGNEYFVGRLDEVRWSKVVRSRDWIKLAYQNQRRDAAPLFNPSPSDFSATRKYAFNTTKTGANVMGDVSNFPVLVRITGSTLVDAVQNDYDDIRFLDGDGKTWLNYQVERWDKTADSAEVWVLVPQVDGNSDHDFITLYYDDVSNGAVADGQCPTCVFASSNNFAGVWHLNAAFADASTNANNGTNSSSTDAGGIIGRGRDFDAGSSQYVEVPYAASLNLSAYTFSAWTKVAVAGATRGIISSRFGGEYTFDAQWTTNSLHADIGNGTSWITTTADYALGSSPAGNWHHVTWAVNGTGYTIYLNGSQAATGTYSGTPQFMKSGETLRIGQTSSSGYFSGTIDEPRVDNTVRSADWIKLNYETQRYGGNVFWNARPGPNNTATLTATDAGGSIAMAWTTPVSDSSAADSVGIWLRYSGLPDSVGATGQTRVVVLPKTDSTYSYPANYPGLYYFALAVRNAGGQWSPFTGASSDTVTLGGSTFLTDTVYVDSAIGNNSNSCAQAQNPATPKLTIVNAMSCESAGTHDSLVVRVMPGSYTDNNLDPNVKPQVITSFDVNSRAVLNGSASVSDGGTRNATVVLRNDLTLKNMDVKCGTHEYTGVYIFSSDANSRVDGCRIYNSGSNKHYYGISFLGNPNNLIHIANNLVYQPNYSGIYVTADNSFNIVNNTLIGNGTATHRGIWHAASAGGYTDITIANNILYNWDYGITTVSANVGVVSNNLFHLVTSGREVTVTSDANKILKDPVFASTNPTDRHGFKLLPGSPAIDAGTATYATGGGAVPYRSTTDLYGSLRTLGTAPDIGAYEGTGYTTTPAGEFDTLTTSTTATTATVENSKWKIVFDMANGGGINGFYDKTTAPGTNLLTAGTTLFDAKVDAYTASANTTFPPTFLERTRTRAVVRQRLNVSASLDVSLTYSIYASGHVYVESELANLTGSTLAVGTLDYTLKLGTTTTAYASGGTKNGFGYLTTGTRDAALSVARDLDGGAASAETWSASAAVSGSPGTVVFKTTDLVDIAKNLKRRHNFLLYLGDNALDYTKSATLHSDVYTPSPLSVSSGSLLMERTWQDALLGHWNLDDAAGSTARDKAVYAQNNAAITSSNNPVTYKWVSGKVGAGLYLTAADVATVTDNAGLEAARGMTVMFWIKPDFAGTGTTAYIVSKGLTSSDGWNFRKVSGQNQITFTLGAASVTTPTLTDAVWTHIAVVCWSNGSYPVEMFVNGVFTGASTVSATAADNASNLLFGYSAGGAAADKFQGTLDDIRFFRNEIYPEDILAIYNRGFSSKLGHYALRADNNNRVVALINESAAQTRVQPAFRISNWYGPKTPKFIYLDGVRLKPLTDFVVDSVGNAVYGAYLILQLNKILTEADQTLFIDDDDSTGFMGEAGRMKTLTITKTVDDKIAIKNFADTVFGAASSAQWYMELDINGWSPTPSSHLTDTGFGAVNVFKNSYVSPNLAISAAAGGVGQHSIAGKSLAQMKFDGSGNQMMDGALGYTSPGNITFTMVDSSATRLSVVTNTLTSTAQGTVTFTKRWTFYPTGRMFGSIAIATSNLDLDATLLYFNLPYTVNTQGAWGSAYAVANSRYALLAPQTGYFSMGAALLGIKNPTVNTTSPGTMLNSVSGTATNSGGSSYKRMEFDMKIGLFRAVDAPLTVNFMTDFSRNFTDSATADSVLKDVQTPAALTAITGSLTTAPYDALDFNTDNFAEGDGAYIYSAAGTGIAHFRFVNSVTTFNPAFRINTWTFGTLPEFVVLDNQVLTKGYHYNAYLNTATGEVVMQFNKTLAPGTHVFYISHKSGLAVRLSAFEAKGGEGADTLTWTTESEFENLGYFVYRRVSVDQLDSSFSDGAPIAGAGIANALRTASRNETAKRAAAKLALARASTGDSLAGGAGDSLPSQKLTAEELAALGFERINPRFIPGAKGGSSAATQHYRFIDRTAAFGVAYEYLLESVDFNGNREQYGPRVARPTNPLITELQSNYPNPFNPITTLRFSLKEKLKVSLVIYDSKGRLVRTLIRNDKAMLPGKYRLTWDARDNGGLEAPSGQYFYRFTAGRYVKARKMLLVK